MNIRPISGRGDESLAVITGEIVVEVGGQEVDGPGRYRSSLPEMRKGKTKNETLVR